MLIKTWSKNALDIQLDERDYNLAANSKWYNKNEADGRIRIYTYIDGKMITINKQVFNQENGECIYHKNGNKADFTRENILILTRKEYGHLFGGKNRETTSKYYGVYFCNSTHKWWVRVNKEEKQLSEHSYFKEEEAAIVADFISIEKYGLKANKNFPEISLNDLSQSYKEIKQRYGETIYEIKSKSMQGECRVKSKASQYVGVIKNKNRKKQWCARIKQNGKTIFIGNFEDEIDAAKAYDKKAVELYGKHAKTNF